MSDRPAAAVTEIAVVDELDIATMPRLHARVEAALATRPQTLTVDLSLCPFAGIDAVEELAALTSRARRQGTSLVLIGLRPVVRMAIEAVGLQDRLLYNPAQVRRITSLDM